MKRWIHDNFTDKDDFDRAWEAKFGEEQDRQFDSIEDFQQWMKEVNEFEVNSDQSVRQSS